jgi:predicted phage-related endonuclease
MIMFKVINLDQRTDDWHIHRRSHANASEAGVIMGTPGYDIKTWRQLAEVKMGVRKVSLGFGAIAGIENEPHIKELWEIESDRVGSAHVVTGIGKSSFLSASLDWLEWDPHKNPQVGVGRGSEQEWLAEFKSPAHGARSKLWAAVTECQQLGPNQAHITAQLQHQMLVTGAEKIMLVVYDSEGDRIATLEVLADKPYQYELKRQWALFWAYYENGELPPAMDGDVIDMSGDDILEDDVVTYLQIKKELAELNKQEKKKRREIEERANGQSISCGGLQVDRITRKGAVDWRAIQQDEQLSDVLIERYRKESSVYYKFTEKQDAH